MRKVYKFGLKWLLMVPLAFFLGGVAFGQSASSQGPDPAKGSAPVTEGVAHDAGGAQWQLVKASDLEGFSRSALESGEAYEARLERNLASLREHGALRSVTYDAQRMELTLEWNEPRADKKASLQSLSSSIKAFTSPSNPNSR